MQKVRQTKIATEAELCDALGSAKGVLLKFYTESCQPCRSYKKIIDNYETDRDLLVCEVDASAARELREKYKIMSVPHLVVVGKGGSVVDEQVGLLSAAAFDAFVRKNFPE